MMPGDSSSLLVVDKRKLRDLFSISRKRMVVEGATAATSTEVFKKLPVSNDKFKPAIVDGEYALQIVFKRTALEQLASLGREILPE
jgi:hypothetical protein